MSTKQTPSTPTEILTPLTSHDKAPMAPPQASHHEIDGWITFAMLGLTLFIGAIIFLQFRGRQQNPAHPSENNDTPQDAVLENTLPIALTPKESDTDTNTTAADAASTPPGTLTTPEDAPRFFTEHFASAEHFAQLVAPLDLEKIASEKWLPSHLWPQLELTKQDPKGLIALQYAAPSNLDYILILCQQRADTPPTRNENSQADVISDSINIVEFDEDPASPENQDNPKLVLVFRSYRLSISPDPVNIYSHALEATAEGFHDTLLLYKTAEPLPLKAYQQFISDGIAIFESLATPTNPEQRSEWLER